MFRTLTTLLLLAGCTAPATGESGDESGREDSGTQIGGIDCDYDKLEVAVLDPSGDPAASHIRTEFPDSDVLETDCPANGCQLELAGAGTYHLVVTADAGRAELDVRIDEDDRVGTTTADCGSRPVYEDAVTVDLVADGGGGDILTSNLGLPVYASTGEQVSGTATISDASGGVPWTRTCAVTRCWIDVSGPGTHHIAFAGDNGETGALDVTLGPADRIGVNELGDDVYERDVRIDLVP